MAEVSLILGESGSGKSRSLKNLPAGKTFLVNVDDKPLPFKGSNKMYQECEVSKHKGADGSTVIDEVVGNMLASKKTLYITNVLKWVSDNRPEIRFIVVDDNQYLSLFTYLERIDERDWAKYNTIAVNMIHLVEECKKLRSNIQVFFLQHVENSEDVSGNRQVQAKTMGKFVKEKVTYEGLFTTVLLCDKEEGEEDGTLNHFFWTRRANSTVKTPEGMFDDQKIENDLLKVAKAIHEYYN